MMSALNLCTHTTKPTVKLNETTQCKGSLRWTVGPGAQLSGAQFATFWGADSWAPDNQAPGPSCPGPNLSLFQGKQLGPGQLGPEPIGICYDIFDDLRIFFFILRCHFNGWDGWLGVQCTLYF